MWKCVLVQILCIEHSLDNVLYMFFKQKTKTACTTTLLIYNNKLNKIMIKLG